MQRSLLLILIFCLLIQNKEISDENVENDLNDYEENQPEYENVNTLLALKSTRLRNMNQIPEDEKKLAQNLLYSYNFTTKSYQETKITNIKPIINNVKDVTKRKNSLLKGEQGLPGTRGLQGDQGLKGEKGDRGSSGIDNQKSLSILENRIVQNGNNILFFDNKIDSLEKIVKNQRDQILYQEKILKQLIKRLTELGLDIY